MHRQTGSPAVPLKGQSWTAAFAKYLQLFRFAGLLHPYRWSVVTQVAARIGTMLLGMVAPLAMRFLIDEVVPRADWTGLYWMSAALAAVLAASLVLALCASFVATRLDQKVGFDLKRAVQAKWEKLPLAYFQQWGVGEHIYRCTTDVHNVTSGLAKVLPELLTTHVQFGLFLVISATLHLQLTLWFVLSLPLVIAVELFHSRALRPVQSRAQTLSSRVNDTIGQYASGIVAVKVFQREKFASRRYVAELSDLVRLAFRRWGIDTRYQALGFCAGTVWGWGVILYGFTLVMRGELTLGTLIALKLYLTALARPVQEISALIQAAVVGSVSAERLHETLAAVEESPARDAARLDRPLPQGAASLCFDSVAFGYVHGSPVLASVTASFPETGMLGITGPSGAGKTTLVSLISRLYDPWCGTISIAGRDLQDMTAREVRACMAIVPQETFLFAGTVAENIAYGDPRASIGQIVQAARLAEAHDFIIKLQDGYATRISASGAGLSLGQRQRIGVARALVKDSSILIVDEGLNAIDEPVRARIVESLAALARRKAVVFITHELQSLERCDRVFVILDGRLVDGTPRDAQHRGSGFMQYLRLKTQYERVPAGA